MANDFVSIRIIVSWIGNKNLEFINHWRALGAGGWIIGGRFDARNFFGFLLFI